jgi:hypothetical protein
MGDTWMPPDVALELPAESGEQELTSRRAHVKPSPSVARGDTRQSRRTMTVYYDRGEIEVTSQHLVIGADIYPIRAISDVRVEHRAVPGGLLVAATLGPSELVVVTMAVRGVSPQLIGVAFAVTLGVTAIAVLFAAIVWPRTYELWIDYEGVSTKVLSSPEEWRIRQLARAVVRALRDQTGPH